MKNNFTHLLKPYFDWLTDNFGNLAKQVEKNNIDSGTIARDYLSDNGRRQRFRNELPHFHQQIENFWRQSRNVVDSEVNNLPGVKARFGGDIGPQVSDSIFEKAGLYFETILVPDPLIRVIRIPDAVTKFNDYYFLKYAVNQVLLKGIFLAEAYPPIAVLTDDIEFNKENKNVALNLATLDTIAVINDIYNTNFDNIDEIKAFFNKFRTIHDAAENAAKPNAYYWSENVNRNLSSQTDALIEEVKKEVPEDAISEEYESPLYLLKSVFTRMLQSNSVAYTAEIYKSHPLIAAPISYHWYSLKILATQRAISRELGIKNNFELTATNALLSQNLNWLSNITISNLIELRKKGQLSDIRGVINKQFEILSTADIFNSHVIVNQVDYNLSSEFSKHQEKIKGLDNSLRTELGILIPTFLASVTASIQPSLIPSASQWVTQAGNIIGTTSLASIVKELIQYMRERRELRKSPIGILWSAKQKANIED